MNDSLAIELGSELEKLTKSSAVLVKQYAAQQVALVEIRQQAIEGLGAPVRSPDEALRAILRKANEALGFE